MARPIARVEHEGEISLRLRTDRRLLTVLLLCLLVTSGCSELNRDADLAARITEAGYSDVRVVPSDPDLSSPLTIYASGGPEGDDGGDIARLVWDTYPGEVDRVVVELGRVHHSATAKELEERFGPREVEYDPNLVVKWVAGIGAFLLLVFGTVFALLISFVVVTIRRRRLALRATRR
ncbi:hypothetical protein [Saccharothrix variisporea]|uniref:Uncharacterized protein n=1 Tax=Saccharothrix variisporea TaxID=543527 RepID=A0A495X6B2_9PSEU|nr:hypothetical protein [Saccharothrix variisporea]RKT69069.1 hypothetical protein DFJ66_2262 [Saccharothrix variisporea]